MRKKKVLIVIFLFASAVMVWYWLTPFGSAAPLGGLLVFGGIYSILSRLRLGRIGSAKQQGNTKQGSNSNLKRFVQK